MKEQSTNDLKFVYDYIIYIFLPERIGGSLGAARVSGNSVNNDLRSKSPVLVIRVFFWADSLPSKTIDPQNTPVVRGIASLLFVLAQVQYRISKPA